MIADQQTGRADQPGSGGREDAACWFQLFLCGLLGSACARAAILMNVVFCPFACLCWSNEGDSVVTIWRSGRQEPGLPRKRHPVQESIQKFRNHGSARTVSHFLSSLAGIRLVNAAKPILCVPFPFPEWSGLCVVCMPTSVKVSAVIVHLTPGRGRPSSC